MRDRLRTAGVTLVELLFTLTLLAIAIGMAVPVTTVVFDQIRTAGAARYLAGRILSARMEAIKRSTPVGLRFQPSASDDVFRCYMDGNGNGIRAADIERGTDPALSIAERIGDGFPGVRFELLRELPDIDGVRDGRVDGIRIGAARILTLDPDGTATSGTLYVRGRRAQYAVRVLGATGRTRVFQYHTGERRWISR
jgi:type II secretion system GspH-like protein